MSALSSSPFAAHVGKHPGEPNVMDPALIADPFGGYGALREQGPVVRGRFMDDSPVWLVTRFEEVRQVLRDQRFLNDPTAPSLGRSFDDSPTARLLEMMGLPEHFRPYLLGSILNNDAPDHTRLRRLVSRAFTARKITDLRPRVEQIADELLTRLPEYAEDGVVDLIKHFAYPLPIAVICELVGIAEADRPQWRKWGADLVSLQPDRLSTSFPAMIEHIHELIRERRGALTDDLLSELIRAHDDDGGRLSDVEMVTMILTVVLAGHETTAHLIGNGTAALLTHPDQLRLLRDDPALFPRAVHELLRWCGPVHMTQMRFASEDVDIAGTKIRKGDAVQLILVSANFDPRHYTDPERLDLTRHPAGHAENHVGFGHGMHYCLGATLAKQEGEVALAKLFAHYPEVSLGVAPEQLERTPLPGSWRLDSLPLRLR
ncbi:cytochrome P450 [Streptomyces libani]|uniref:Cytochrome P450 n=1 Tax=Streptomyces nigrescens TaxID=1920 RepID=A0A640TJ15_STRNI|nr:cytochrome P450 [Streptomyces libani]WAT97642.1 cytochrome P450 [Streptomyces libani subsp. libani]GFE23154.1 cytochrome P450 [Streptomyces libani subsp. libani]GGV92223.1 cytochrome P450 [Streptomyces libani subsp. libani]